MCLPNYLLPPHAFKILIDYRERLPLTFPGFHTEFVKLDIGDYALMGYEGDAAVERKSKQDFLHCLLRERRRIDRQLERLMSCRSKLLIIEANALDLECQRNWPRPDLLTPEMVNAYIQKWQVRGLPIELAGTHQRASHHVLTFLLQAAAKHFSPHHPFFDYINQLDPILRPSPQSRPYYRKAA